MVNHRAAEGQILSDSLSIPAQDSGMLTCVCPLAAPVMKGLCSPVVVVLDDVDVRRKQVPALGPEASRVQDLFAHKHHVQLWVEGNVQQNVRAAQLEARARKRRVSKFPELHQLLKPVTTVLLQVCSTQHACASMGSCRHELSQSYYA